MPLTPGQISDRLEHGGKSQLARDLKVSDAYVSRVIQGHMRPCTPRGQKTLRRVQVAIARRIGMKVADVFASPLGLATSEGPEHARHDGRDVLGGGESRARFAGGVRDEDIKRRRVASG